MNDNKLNYPKPSRTPAIGGVKVTQYFREIDTGRSEVLLDDGRPGLIEYWYDVDTQLDCVTAIYSTADIENWSEDQHLEYLKRNDIIKANVRGYSTMKCADEAGMPMWSFNWVEE